MSASSLHSLVFCILHQKSANKSYLSYIGGNHITAFWMAWYYISYRWESLEMKYMLLEKGS